MIKLQSIPIQPVHLNQLNKRGVTVHVKRDDLLHPQISGNKFYKLKLSLDEAMQLGHSTILTFGGAYSNHLHATAFAGRMLDMKTVGVVRGQYILPLTPTLKDCVKWGMELVPMRKDAYAQKDSTAVIASLESAYPSAYIIPEGGECELGVRGAEAILEGVDQSLYDYIVVACGTGTTVAGIIRAAKPTVKVIGVPVLKNAEWMYQVVKSWLPTNEKQTGQWELWLEEHWGGYAKQPAELMQKISEIYTETSLQLDGVYTGKAFIALLNKIQNGIIPSGSRVLFVHTGGLQGNRSSTQIEAAK